jgi:lipopolysaccharide/colanic/teichoic acid biosynthesis glycosyltransferase
MLKQMELSEVLIGHRSAGPVALRTLHVISVPDGSVGKDAYYLTKRVLDVCLSLAALVILLPLFIAIAIVVKQDSPGPAFFCHERVGSRRRKRGQMTFWEIRHFPCYKFRSMRCDVDQGPYQEYIRQFCQGAVTEKLKRDPRVTTIGRILRKTSLDELPQLLNVLLGDMSLVGPRPVPPYEVAQYQDAHYERLAAIPGISGLWQVEGRGRVTFDEMIRMDVDYARRASLWLDLKIMVRTVPAVLFGHGAN